MSILFAGIIAAIAFIFLLMKFDLKKVLGYDAIIDIGFSGMMMFVLAGTFSGMMSALIGGAVLSMFLFFARRMIGYKRLYLEHGRLRWKEHGS